MLTNAIVPVQNSLGGGKGGESTMIKSPEIGEWKMNGGFSSESGRRTVVFKHTCLSSGFSSRLQAYHLSAIDIS